MPQPEAQLLKVIACEIAFREISFLAAQSRHAIDVEFVTQGLHDHPNQGREEVQRRIDAVPAGKYNAILLGYGLCGNIIRDLTTPHTPLVIPRAHDCITFFLGSRDSISSNSPNCGPARTTTPPDGWSACVAAADKAGVHGTTVPPDPRGPEHWP